MSKPYVLGIDIGGTNTVFGMVDARGNVIATSSIKTAKHDKFEDYLDDLHAAVMRMLEANDATDKIHGIGVGAPNANYYTGNIEHAPNLPWKGILPIANMMSEKFGIPVVITNDANAAALGEMTYGAARGLRDFIMITLGTGVGSGIVINGQLVYGHDGFAGELGVARTAREFLEIRNDDSKLRELPIDAITSKDVYDAAVLGDKLAKEIFEYTGNILGEAFADFTVFSSPEAIILFGGLAKSGDLLMRPLRESMEKNMMGIFKGKVKILLSELKEADAAVLGASALGWEAGSKAAALQGQA